MPPATRKSSASNPRPTSQQKTLSFGRTSNKVTKPSLPPPSKKTLSKSKSSSLLKAASPSPALEDEAEPTPTAQLAIREQQQGKVESVEKEAKSVEKEAKSDESEERARRVGEAQIKRYWKGKEDERKAARVHQEGLSINEKILRHFDLSNQYGPCIGIARMKRWKRAERLGLKPPIEVLAVLVREEAAGNGKVERAYVDELLSGKVGGQ